MMATDPTVVSGCGAWCVRQGSRVDWQCTSISTALSWAIGDT